jgi:hypothetical protein
VETTHNSEQPENERERKTQNANARVIGWKFWGTAFARGDGAHRQTATPRDAARCRAMARQSLLAGCSSGPIKPPLRHPFLKSHVRGRAIGIVSGGSASRSITACGPARDANPSNHAADE